MQWDHSTRVNFEILTQLQETDTHFSQLSDPYILFRWWYESQELGVLDRPPPLRPMILGKACGLIEPLSSSAAVGRDACPGIHSGEGVLHVNMQESAQKSSEAYHTPESTRIQG